MNGTSLPSIAFIERQIYYSEQMKKGTYLRNPEATGAPPSLTDPSAMEGMISMVKGQAMNFVPQTVMMSWISALFSGFVLSKLRKEKNETSPPPQSTDLPFALI